MFRLVLTAILLAGIGALAVALLLRARGNRADAPTPPRGPSPIFVPRQQPGEPEANSGAGTGLSAEYFNGENFESRQLARVDPTVDFNWPASPGSPVDANHFSVRWTGQVEAEHSETYTFYAVTDDGARLWVGGQKLIDDWRPHGTEELTGTTALQAGHRYDIRLEFFDKTSLAEVHLFWSSPSTPKQIVPTRWLYPAAGQSSSETAATTPEKP